MARRRNSQPDSLDLLLDTMCNTFGGIVMIALLMALVVREEKRATTTTAPVEQALAQLNSKRLEEQIAAALAQLQQMKAQMARLGPVAELLAQRDTLARKKKDAESAAEAARREKADAKDKNAKGLLAIEQKIEQIRADQAAAINDHKTVDATIAATKQLIAHLLNELRGLGGATNTRQIKRPPREEMTSKTPLPIVFRHNEIYPVQKLAGGSFALNTTDITWNGDEAMPKKGAGKNVKTHREELLAMLKGLPVAKVYVSSYVFGDSFEAFIEFQKIIADAGIEAGWKPMPEGLNPRFGLGGAVLPKQ